MESPNRRYLPAVDHLRAFAALLIIFYHSFHLLTPRLALHRPWEPTDWIHTRNFFLAAIVEGHTAVALFLVISGFILTYGSLGRDISYGGFFRNRFLRLFPLFFFILITGANAFRPQFQFSTFVAWVLQFGYLTSGPPFGPWTGVSWSISVEAQLYLLFPVIRHYLSKDQLWPLFRLAVIVWLVRVAAFALGAGLIDLTYATALGRVDQFLAGAILAWLIHRYGIPRKLAALFPLIALGACAALYGFHLSGGYPATQSWRLAWPTAEAVVWAAFVGSYLAFARHLPGFVDALLRFVGRISYSVYLIHIIVIWIFAEKGWYFSIGSLTVNENIVLTVFAMVLPVVIPVSTLTYVSIEKPFLEMRSRYNPVKQESVSA
jgi:peptidoglycan/LPS O-acetylase OafA/YrhL